MPHKMSKCRKPREKWRSAHHGLHVGPRRVRCVWHQEALGFPAVPDAKVHLRLHAPREAREALSGNPTRQPQPAVTYWPKFRGGTGSRSLPLTARHGSGSSPRRSNYQLSTRTPSSAVATALTWRTGLGRLLVLRVMLLAPWLACHPPRRPDWAGRAEPGALELQQ